MDPSIFDDKQKIPGIKDLQNVLGKNYQLWEDVTQAVDSLYPAHTDEWKFPGAKYGWFFRMKDKKRAILYFIPHRNYFEVAFVFGKKAVASVMNSKISEKIKSELGAAKVYAEGQGIRIRVDRRQDLPDIIQLAAIKIAN